MTRLIAKTPNRSARNVTRPRAVMFTSIAIALTTAASGCANDRTCERKRLGLAKTFQQVKLTAADAKKLDSVRQETMSAEAQKEHHDHWAKIENKAALLESAFYTRQVTWDSAQNALGEAQTLYGEKHGEGLLEQGFGELLKQAEQAFGEFRKDCR